MNFHLGYRIHLDGAIRILVHPGDRLPAAKGAIENIVVDTVFAEQRGQARTVAGLDRGRELAIQSKNPADLATGRELADKFRTYAAPGADYDDVGVFAERVERHEKTGGTSLYRQTEPYELGRMTVSITWITPLLASISVAITLALLICTPLSATWMATD